MGGIGCELPVVDGGLAPDDLVVDGCGICGGRVPLEDGVVVEVGSKHTDVLRRRWSRGERGGDGDVEARDLRGVRGVDELEQVTVLGAVLGADGLVLVVEVLAPVGEADGGEAFVGERAVIAAAEEAVEAEFHDGREGGGEVGAADVENGAGELARGCLVVCADRQGQAELVGWGGREQAGGEDADALLGLERVIGRGVAANDVVVEDGFDGPAFRFGALCEVMRAVEALLLTVEGDEDDGGREAVVAEDAGGFEHECCATGVIVGSGGEAVRVHYVADAGVVVAADEDHAAGGIGAGQDGEDIAHGRGLHDARMWAGLRRLDELVERDLQAVAAVAADRFELGLDPFGGGQYASAWLEVGFVRRDGGAVVEVDEAGDIGMDAISGDLLERGGDLRIGRGWGERRAGGGEVELLGGGSEGEGEDEGGEAAHGVFRVTLRCVRWAYVWKDSGDFGSTRARALFDSDCMAKKVQRIGILTAGGDSPGLNAAIRGVGKAALGFYGMEVVGFRDGFRGLVENHRVTLDSKGLSGILTLGGTILGTSRDKPHRMVIDGKTRDMTGVIRDNLKKWGIDCLVCLGGGGTAKNALRLHKAGINVITLPKTIDNDVAMTDATFGYATALDIATDAIDRLHSTAHSHHRIIVAEVMGHRAGWLTLGAGLAGGADVILIPEISYNVKKIAAAISQRSKRGSNFSIVAVAEGAMSEDDAHIFEAAEKKLERAKTLNGKLEAKRALAALDVRHQGNTIRLAQQLEHLTHLESRVTILGYVQRGGTPCAADRMLATRLGTAAADLIQQGRFGVMVAARGEGTEPVPLEQVAGKRKAVPRDHSWIESARRVGTCLGN